jgi:hypothetical protein
LLLPELISLPFLRGGRGRGSSKNLPLPLFTKEGSGKNWGGVLKISLF